jgi:hypothetical protein
MRLHGTRPQKTTIFILNRTDYFEDTSINGKIILKWLLQAYKLEINLWNVFIWLKIRTSGGLL